jgi:hypothetical protein
VLTSDASGNASWKNSTINTGFSVFNSANQTIPSGSATQLSFNTIDFDDAVAFNTTNGTYTAPSAGVYQFNATVVWNLFSSGSSYTTLELYKGATLIRQCIQPANTNYNSVNMSVTVKLNAGDQITLRAYQNTGVGQTTLGGAVYYTRFSGFRVY